MNKSFSVVILFVALCMNSCQVTEVADNQSSIHIPVSFVLGMDNSDFISSSIVQDVPAFVSDIYKRGLAPFDVDCICIKNYSRMSDAISQDRIYNLGSKLTEAQDQDIIMNVTLGINRFLVEASTITKARFDFVDLTSDYKFYKLYQGIGKWANEDATSLEDGSFHSIDIKFSNTENVNVLMKPINSIIEISSKSYNPSLFVEVDIFISQNPINEKPKYVFSGRDLKGNYTKILNTDDFKEGEKLNYRIRVMQRGMIADDMKVVCIKTYFFGANDGFGDSKEFSNNKIIKGNKVYKLKLDIEEDSFAVAATFTMNWETDFVEENLDEIKLDW